MTQWLAGSGTERMEHPFRKCRAWHHFPITLLLVVFSKHTINPLFKRKLMFAKDMCLIAFFKAV